MRALSKLARVVLLVLVGLIYGDADRAIVFFRAGPIVSTIVPTAKAIVYVYGREKGRSVRCESHKEVVPTTASTVFFSGNGSEDHEADVVTKGHRSADQNGETGHW